MNSAMGQIPCSTERISCFKSDSVSLITSLDYKQSKIYHYIKYMLLSVKLQLRAFTKQFSKSLTYLTQPFSRFSTAVIIISISTFSR